MNARMLGNVSLEVHGTTDKTEMMDALKNAVARSEYLTGRLYIGWPIGAEATLISDRGQVTAIDLSSTQPDQDYQERQDTAFVAVDRTFRLEPALMERRQPRIDVKTLTVCAGVRQTFPDDPEHPLVAVSGAARKLEELQQNFAPEGINPNTATEALMRIHLPDEGNIPPSA